MTSPYPKTMEFLIAEGIDPSIITVDDINEATYTEIVVDPQGKRILRSDGNLAARRREWPRPGMGEEVMRLILEDIKNFPPIRVVDEHGTIINPVDNAVIVRRRYDMDPSEEHSAAWLAAENRLTPAEFEQYMALYRSLPAIDQTPQSNQPDSREKE